MSNSAPVGKYILVVGRPFPFGQIILVLDVHFSSIQIAVGPSMGHVDQTYCLPFLLLPNLTIQVK